MKHKITYDDLQEIISMAKHNCAYQNLPIALSRRHVTSVESSMELVAQGPVHVAMIEAFISYLNSKGLLKEEVNFDYQERKS